MYLVNQPNYYGMLPNGAPGVLQSIEMMPSQFSAPMMSPGIDAIPVASAMMSIGTGSINTPLPSAVSSMSNVGASTQASSAMLGNLMMVRILAFLFYPVVVYWIHNMGSNPVTDGQVGSCVIPVSREFIHECSG